MLLSLALEKGAVQAGPPPGQETPAVRDLLSTVNPELITSVLERALDDRRPAVILPAVRALGEMDDVRAGRPGDHGESALERALIYPDRRVQMAAADAIVRISGEPAPQTAGRIVEVWRRAAWPPTRPTGRTASKVIVGYFGEESGNRVADAVRKAGYDPIQVRSGRDVLNRLNQAADVDLVLIDEAGLPDPGLPSLLAQLRADLHYGRVPVVLTVSKEREDAIRRYAERAPNVSVLPFALALNVAELKPYLQGRLDDAGPVLSEAELKEYAEKAVHHLADVAKGSRPGFDVRPTAETAAAAYLQLPPTPAVPEAARSTPSKSWADCRALLTPQTELADVALDEKRPPKVRAAATAELVRHIQEHSLTLTGTQIDTLAALYAKAGDKELKEKLAAVTGRPAPQCPADGRTAVELPAAASRRGARAPACSPCPRRLPHSPRPRRPMRCRRRRISRRDVHGAATRGGDSGQVAPSRSLTGRG